MRKSQNSFQTKSDLTIGGKKYTYYSLKKLDEKGLIQLKKLPFSIRVLLENVLREEDGYTIHKEDVQKIFHWKKTTNEEISFYPARVVLQDFTGVPCVVDLADMRDAMKEMGGDPKKINPVVPVDLVVDHSVQVDHYGSKDALRLNTEIEFGRNKERYALLKWAQKNLNNFRAVPPGAGIVHQVNLEFLATVVMENTRGGEQVLFPDSLVGTDSHTTMINGVGVYGFGVGGIEAEAVMLGQPYNTVVPEVIGVRLVGKLPEGATATDLVLTITEMLRKEGVVEKIVEYFGPGLDTLSVPDRATISNMSPEYGATMGFFPVDQRTLEFLQLTNRGHLVPVVEAYCKAQGLFREKGDEPEFTKVLEMDISKVEPCLAGPKRPQDRVLLKSLKSSFEKSLSAPLDKRGFAIPAGEISKEVKVSDNGSEYPLRHGSVVIAAITSCTNTSNPSVLISAGLLAKKALEKGLQPKPWVKTSLAPGSQVVVEYLQACGLMEPLEKANFYLVGFGCTTCIGNSGPLKDPIVKAVQDNKLVVSGVLSGNRNFEGRIHPNVKANYLASPPLVVLYAFLGRVDVDLNEPLGKDGKGNPVYLKDIWPTLDEVNKCLSSITAKMFEKRYATVFDGEEGWNSLKVGASELFPWEGQSTYIKRPPYFKNFKKEIGASVEIRNARVLAFLGDSVTTDHISPAGNIAKNGPAGKYLLDHKVESKDFNSFGARRGNHEVMIRGTFANVQIRNKMAPGTEGGVTLHLPGKEQMSIFDAAEKYQSEKIPTIVLGGKEYGTGSSRDWAAKGTLLLGVKAVIAESYERIHRSNLVGMGVLPLQFKKDESAQTLGLTGHETFDILLGGKPTPRQEVKVVAKKEDGSKVEFKALSRLDTQVDVDNYLQGGLLPAVLRKML